MAFIIICGNPLNSITGTAYEIHREIQLWTLRAKISNYTQFSQKINYEESTITSFLCLNFIEGRFHLSTDQRTARTSHTRCFLISGIAGDQRPCQLQSILLTLLYVQLLLLTLPASSLLSPGHINRLFSERKVVATDLRRGKTGSRARQRPTWDSSLWGRG